MSALPRIQLEALRDWLISEIDREQARVIPRDGILDTLQEQLVDVRAALAGEAS